MLLPSPPDGNNYFVNFARRTLNIFWLWKIILWLAQKRFPRATQGSLKSDKCRKQYVHFTSFNFLNCAGMQSHHFGKSFLGDSLKHSFAANIVAERFELRCLGTFQWHALLRRLTAILNTAQWGAKTITAILPAKNLFSKDQPEISCSRPT